MWLDKINIEERIDGFEKVSGGNAWNASARFSEPISRENSATISCVVDATFPFAFGFSEIYQQGQRNIQYGFIIENGDLITYQNGTEQNNGAVLAGDILEIRKERNPDNEFLLVFRKNNAVVDSVNISYSWRLYYAQFSIFTEFSEVSLFEVVQTPPPITPPPDTPDQDWWQKNAFRNLFPAHWRKYDSSKDENNKGFLERYIELYGKYFDEELLPLIRNFVQRVHHAKDIDEANIPYLERMFGVNIDLLEDLPTRRRVLQNFLEFTKLKGSKRGFEAGIKMIRFGDLVIDFVSVEPDYTGHNCNACVPYDFGVTGNFVLITEELKEAMFRVAGYNEPIYWKLRSLIYNENELVDEVATFYFLGLDDPNLYYDRSNVPSLTATLVGANLVIDGINEQYYEFDSVYLDNKGNAIFRKPSDIAIPDFISYPCDQVTSSIFRISWAISAGADSYTINVGKSRNSSNTIITEKLVDNLVVTHSTTDWTIFDLEENTPYFVQILANHNGKIARSPIQSVITLKKLDAPIADIDWVDFYGFMAEWSAMPNATGYRIDVATDNAFSNKIINNQLLNYPITSKLIEIPSIGQYYFRVKAIKRYDNNENRTPMLESESDWSNVVSTNAQYTDHSFIDYSEIDYT